MNTLYIGHGDYRTIWKEYKSCKSNNDFFSYIDNSVYSDDIRLAEEYIKFLYASEAAGYKEIAKNTNIAVVPEGMSLEYATKKCFLISDQLVLSNNSNSVLPISNGEIGGQGVMAGDGPCFTENLLLRCDSLNSLGKWIRESKDLLCHEKVFYLPNYVIHASGFNTGKGDLKRPVGDIDEVQELGREMLQKAVRLSKEYTSLERTVNSHLMNTAIEIEIPVMDDISMKEFSDVTLDSMEHYETFRNYLSRKILSCDFPEDLYSFQKDAKMISLELSDKLKNIERANKKTVSKYLAKSFITFSSFIAHLFIVDQSVLDIIDTIFSGLNGEDSFSDLFFNYCGDRKQRKEQDIYYLWLLSDKAK